MPGHREHVVLSSIGARGAPPGGGVATRFVRLYDGPAGIWRYEVERDGAIYYGSLHTKNERVARLMYDRMQRHPAAAQAGPVRARGPA